MTHLGAYTCRISGLTVSSELELPGVIPAAVSPGAEDVRVRLRCVPESLETPVVRTNFWELDDRRFLLRLPGIGRVLASDGDTLDIESASGTSPNDVLPILLGTAFSALLRQRGRLVLHASAVAELARAWVLCGQSGAGKSTLAAALCRDGCSFANDDICAIAPDTNGTPIVWPDGRQLRLLDESIQCLDMNGRRRGAIRLGIPKIYVDPPGPAIQCSLPLGAVYVLGDGRFDGDVEIQRLSPVESAQVLMSESYRPRLALTMARQSRQVPNTSAVLSHASVFHLAVPRRLDRLAETVAALRAHWRGLIG